VSLDGQAIFASPRHKKEARVTLDTTRVDKSATGPRLTLADVSIALCAGTILLATLLTQPLVTPEAEAAEKAPQAAAATQPNTPGQGERTVFLPELFLPVGGSISVPIDQF
jgi:hypothetical protein